MVESTKVISRSDPWPGAAASLTMSGLDYLQKMIDKSLPSAPIGALFNMHAIGVDNGDVVFAANNFLRQITADTGKVPAHDWAPKPGSRAAFAESDIRDSAGCSRPLRADA